MFILYANKTQLTVRQREPTTSGSVNVCTARFEFSPDWDGLTRTAVFKAGGVSRAVLLGEDGECVVPWEVLAEYRPLTPLQTGVCGTRGGEVVLPTVWANLGIIQEGVSAGEGARPPTPNLWEQRLDRKGDALAYDGLNLSLMAGDRPLSTVQITGSGEDEAPDHRALSGRDAEDQHPIEAITGLRKTLDKTLTTGDFLSVAEILKIMEV